MSGDPVMTTSPKVDHQASPARRKESTSLSSAKPLWAPLETDAPITLDTGHEVHVCQLCGCWYETLQGLSSHARYHLREMGIPDGDVKGNPVDFLHKIMEDGEQKFVGAKQQEKKLAPDCSARSSLKRSSMQSAPPQSSSKRPKPSEDFTCILCGERFENKKGLGSHARSHLRHIGVSDIVGRSSAVEAVQELVNSGMLEPVRLPKTKTGTISSMASSPVPSSPTAQARPSASRQPWTSLSSSSLSAGHTKSSQAPSNKAPKAKKGFRLAVDPLHRKPKPEPLEMEVSAHPPTTSSSPIQSPGASESHADSDMQSPPTVLCDYCGQLFETRKALSCHARAHLRQLGISWSIRSSPLDILREVMMEEGKKEALNAGKTSWTSRKSSDSLPSASAASSSCASPLDFSMREKSLPLKETSCELCGFDFENRKALASHARAHLRQLGIIEWKIEGASSPIELLSELIRKDPLKVSQITHRYRMGDLYIKKSQRSTVSPSPSTDSDSVAGSSFKSFTQHQQHQQQENKSVRTDSGAAAGSSRSSQGVTRTMVTHNSSSTRSPRGVHPPKHGTTGQTHQHSNSQQPPRSGGIPALLPKPPLTPLVKLVGKIYSLKCRFCEEVFEGPLAVQEQWITHLQKHILTVGFKGKTSLPATPVNAPAFVQPVAV
ncbi:protein Wiz-like [Gouania willdenowi]|uniref:Protein Wiz-like n=1 Tax=Gouania willdenowi TaxID=441366 RepID=A0A8C5DEQ1_GOUWI|nr:protein Wiz-like [Gouania willdenowi]XP_028309787.1 protein Wiz-like [Gouania willdenowi]